jgi:membrane protease YdiL (CAAX protease family)
VKDFGKILLYLAAVILFAALLAPPLWWAGQALAPLGPLGFLAETPFQRYFNRAALLAALALLWPLAASLRIPDRASMGLIPDSRWAPRLGVGLFIGIAAVAALGCALLPLELYKFKKEIPWDELAKLLGTAAVVSALEEFFFRGALLGILRRTSPDRIALAAVSALYAGVHFIKPEDCEIAQVAWHSGFALLPAAFHRFSEPLVLAGGFTTLFAMGWILGDTRLRTGSLWLPAGLHAGLIIGKMGFNKIAKRKGELPPWFTDDLLVGVGPLLAILAAGVAVRLWLHLADARALQSRG